jgi:putrescine transport system substrate-binding protein
MRQVFRHAAAVYRGWQTLVAAALILFLGAPGARADDARILNVYNWSDYVADDTVRNFERETGIKVHYDTFDANEALHAKLRAGHTGYDVVAPSAHWARRQIEGGWLKPLDKNRITTWNNLDPWLMGLLATSANDPGNDHVVPYLWGITTVGINIDRVRSALGNLPMPDDAWDLLFKPEYASRLSKCGISYLDSGDEVYPAALHYVGKPSFSHNKADYVVAQDMLMKVRPYVSQFSSSSYINGLADGSLCVVMGWSGDIALGGQRAKEARNGQRIVSLVPKSGAVMFFDTMAIPVDAPHPDNALRWISYIYRPDVQAAIVKKVLHNSAVRASDHLVPAEVHGIPGIFLTKEELARMEPQEAVPNNILRVRTRMFTAFKTGE